MVTVSVLIVTYNSEQIVWECLKSLDEQTFRDFEVILVDNNSGDSTKAVVESFKRNSAFPFKTVYLDANTGFSLANNIALKSASGRYISLINPDVKADRSWLEELVGAMEGDERVGICASKVLTWDREHIDSSAEVMLTTLRCFKRGAEDPDAYGSPEPVFGACASAALYRRSMIETIGFFDEDFFIQCEDTDLNFRAQLAGWKVLYVPAARAYHRVSFSIGKASDVGVYYTQRNMELIRVKNIPVSLLVLYTPMILAGFMVDFLYFGVKQRKWRLFVKAKVDALSMLPLMLRKRRRIMKEIKRVDNLHIKSLFTPLSDNRRFLVMKLKNFFCAKASKPKKMAESYSEGGLKRPEVARNPGLKGEVDS